jgi:hypothetical protein
MSIMRIYGVHVPKLTAAVVRGYVPGTKPTMDQVLFPQECREHNKLVKCPECDKNVYPRMGERQPHFFHEPGSTCSLNRKGESGPASGGEGPQHMSAKLTIVRTIKDLVIETYCSCCSEVVSTTRFGANYTAQAEVAVGGYRADVGVFDSSGYLHCD